MHIQNSIIYPDEGEVLVGGKYSQTSTISEKFTNGIDCGKVNKLKVPGYTFLQFSDGITIDMPKNKTYESLYKTLVEEGYTADERLSIALNKDVSEDDTTSYNNMLTWLEFASKAAKLIAPHIGIEINETVEEVKNEKIAEITKFDSSTAVNSFTYNGTSLWLDKATRVGLMNSTAILQNAGQTETELWLGNEAVTIACDKAILMLSQIEMYAMECYRVTARHKANVSQLNTVDEIKAYDYTTGYPEKLVFNN